MWVWGSRWFLVGWLLISWGIFRSGTSLFMISVVLLRSWSPIFSIKIKLYAFSISTQLFEGPFHFFDQAHFLFYRRGTFNSRPRSRWIFKDQRTCTKEKGQYPNYFIKDQNLSKINLKLKSTTHPPTLY